VEGLTKVLFRTFGPPAAVAGVNQTELVFEGTTARDFLKGLEARYEGMRNLIHPRGEELSDLMYVLVNGKNILRLDGLETVVRDGDIVSVLPVTAGG
jgi:molybdopterin synthase sulfur carrier subunit